MVDVSIEAMVASKREKEKERRGEEKSYKYTVMNVLVGQKRS